MQLPVSSPIIISELTAAKTILEAWLERVENGVPGVDIPAPPEQLEDFMRGLCGELLVVSTKCENLSNILSGDM